MNQKGFAHVLLLLLVVAAIVFFSPLPSYNSRSNCLLVDMCPQGFTWSKSLYQRIFPQPEIVVDDYDKVRREEELQTKTSDWETYSNIEPGFQFRYPPNLTLSTSAGVIILSHTIPYKNSGDCDLKGGNNIYNTLQDFGVSFEIKQGNVNSIYYDGSFSSGNLTGKWFYEGAEGCGNIIYYFPTSDGNTLVIKRATIQALSGISSIWTKEEILQVPGVITPEESDTLFRNILSTFEFTNQ